MSNRRRLALVVTLAFVGFLVASTGHGRQLRKEREGHGFLQMDPAQGWPPALHEVWQLDRADLRVSTAVAAVVGTVTAVATGGGLWMALLAVLLWAPTVGFFACGVFSLLRLWGHDATAAAATLPGSVALFAVALLCLGGSVILGLFRRPPSRP